MRRKKRLGNKIKTKYEWHKWRKRNLDFNKWNGEENTDRNGNTIKEVINTAEYEEDCSRGKKYYTIDYRYYWK